MLKAKQVICTLVLSLIPLVAAADVYGWIAGFDLGRYDANYKASNQGLSSLGGLLLGPANVSTDEGRFAGRVYLGYSFNDYLQAELGYTRYQDTTYENIYGVNNADVKQDLQSYDLVGMVKLPLNDEFHLYAKLGASNNIKCQSGNGTAKSIPLSGGTVTLPDNDARLYRAIYGVGLAYQLNQTFALNVGWTRIDGQGDIATTDFGYIGIVYYFSKFLTS